jgi:hypothetical protein
MSYAYYRYADGEEAVVPRACVTVQRQRSPIDAWPDAFIFFDRVLGLLRGLTASLQVSVSYLEVCLLYYRFTTALLLRARAAARPDGLPSSLRLLFGGVSFTTALPLLYYRFVYYSFTPTRVWRRGGG